MEAILAHVAPFLMVVFRIAGVFLIAPVLSSLAFPLRIRVLLVFALGIAVYPTLNLTHQAPIALDPVTLGVGVVGETFIGFVIGLIAMLPIAAVQLSGVMMSLQMGFGLAQVVNPALDTESDLLAELLAYIALGVFISVGGLEALFLAVINTFSRIPLGGFTAARAPLDLLVGALSSGFELSIRVSLPVLGLILLESIATAFLTKTLPQLNVMSLGFATKIVLGLLAILAGLRAMDSAMADHLTQVGRQILQWSASA